MNLWFYILLACQGIVWMNIIFSIVTVSSDIELWGEEID
jgi:hypothetical protein